MNRIHLLLYRLALLGLLGQAVPAAAIDYQVHGFASQGFVLSDGNNLFGDSRNGSFDLYELGLNATVAFTPSLIASAQVLARDAGATDDDGLRLDYALLDYQFLSEADANAGLRLGRVKNPIGIYNETRDVIFTRPSILLPQSVYLDGVGIRGLLFSGDGGQLYGGTALGDHELSAIVGYAPSRSGSDEEKRVLSGGGALPGDLELDDFYFARILDDWEGWRFGLSYLYGGLGLEQDGASLAELNARLWVASLQYVAERYSVTAEYSLIRGRGQSVFAGPIRTDGDGGYLQYDYRLTPHWTVFARADASFTDRLDRDGSEYEDSTGQDSRRRYAYDGTLGFNWRPDAHWGVWGEVHLIDGAATVSSLDNPGRQADPHWAALLLMVGYRF